jgi:ATP-dependent DNA helicase PIF1
VLGPTGASAALLNGSTYHSVLGIKDSMESDMFEGVTVKKVQERLRGVEYIFLDEVSMVSCQSMYKISARLALRL